mgnify:CR=1 FL=1
MFRMAKGGFLTALIQNSNPIKTALLNRRLGRTGAQAGNPIPVDNTAGSASAATDPATEFFKKYGRVPTPQELAAFMNPQQPANLAKGGFLTALLRNPEFISRHNLTGSPTGAGSVCESTATRGSG